VKVHYSSIIKLVLLPISKLKPIGPFGHQINKTNMKNKLFILVAISFFFLETYSQEIEKGTLSIDGQFRTRSEYRDGYKTLLTTDQSPSFVVSQRSRLKADFIKKNFEARFSFQDARAWGETYGVNTTKNLLLHEGWVKYNINNMFALKIGRIELNYDDKRIIDWKNWNNYGSSHDLALFLFRNKGVELDLGLSYNNNDQKALSRTTYDVEKYYRSMLYLRGSFKINDNITLNFLDQVLGYNKENSVDTVYYINTAGVNPIINFGDFKFKGSFYFQNGKNKVGTNMQAYTYAAKAEYSLSKLRVGAGYDSFSGKAYNDTDSLTDKKFFAWMGIQHFVMGNMDYLTGKQINTSYGVNDIRFDIKYGKRTSVEAVYHLLSYANSPGESISKSIGSEVDLIASHKFSKIANIKFMYSVMLPSTDFKTASIGDANQRFANFACLILTFKPNFYKTTK